MTKEEIKKEADRLYSKAIDNGRFPTMVEMMMEFAEIILQRSKEDLQFRYDKERARREEVEAQNKILQESKKEYLNKLQDAIDNNSNPDSDIMILSGLIHAMKLFESLNQKEI